jgi:hypothetical protein
LTHFTQTFDRIPRLSVSIQFASSEIERFDNLLELLHVYLCYSELKLLELQIILLPLS